MIAGKTDRSNPAIHAGEGDERIRTAARWLSTSYTYVHRGRDGFVYFVQQEEDRDAPIKIGFSANPAERLRLIQRKHPEPLLILAGFAADMGEEAGLHEHFSHAREHGEWFRPVPACGIDATGDAWWWPL